MDRTLLGLVSGDRVAGTQLQWATANTASVALEPLHDEQKVGNFAVVYRGRVAHGTWHVPVAIKVQRDEPRTPEDTESVVARFNAEAHLHRRLRRPASENRIPLPVVAPVELADTGDEADRIPPSILCRKAKHALALLCPKCGAELESLEDRFDSTPQTPGRVLLCPTNCSGPWKDTPDSRHAILAASVARQSACQGCDREGGPGSACLPDARILNFFPARLLVFELLGESLAQFLGRKPRGSHFPQGPTGPALRPLEWLTTACHLLSDVLDGLELLHGLGVAHLDLKPDNVCLRWSPDRPRAVLIDLGLAGDPAAPAKFREVMTSHKLETDYAPDELQKPTLSGDFTVEKSTREQAAIRFHLPGVLNEATNPLLLPGEVVDLMGDGRTLRATITDSRGANAVVNFGSPLAAKPGKAKVYRATGPAADYFSFGLLAIALLARRGELNDLRELAKNLETALRKLDNRNWPLADCPGRVVVQRLMAAADVKDYSAAFLKLVSDLRTDYGEVAFLAEELLGLALRGLARGIPNWSASQHRGDCSLESRRRIRDTLNVLREAVVSADLGERWTLAEQQRKTRGEQLSQIANSLPAKPGASVNANPERLREMLALLPKEAPEKSAEARLVLAQYAAAPGLLKAHLERLFAPAKSQTDDEPIVRLLLWVRAFREKDTATGKQSEYRARLRTTDRRALPTKWFDDAERIETLEVELLSTIRQIRDDLLVFRKLIYDGDRRGAILYIPDERPRLVPDFPAIINSASKLHQTLLDRVTKERESFIRSGTETLTRWQATATPLLRAGFQDIESTVEVALNRLENEDLRWMETLANHFAHLLRYLTGATLTQGLWSRWKVELDKPPRGGIGRFFQGRRHVVLSEDEAVPEQIDVILTLLADLLDEPLSPVFVRQRRLLLAEAELMDKSQQYRRARRIGS